MASKTYQVDAVTTFNFDCHQVDNALEAELEEEGDDDEARGGHFCAQLVAKLDVWCEYLCEFCTMGKKRE